MGDDNDRLVTISMFVLATMVVFLGFCLFCNPFHRPAPPPNLSSGPSSIVEHGAP